MAELDDGLRLGRRAESKRNGNAERDRKFVHDVSLPVLVLLRF
jgi:hypothetical protein